MLRRNLANSFAAKRGRMGATLVEMLIVSIIVGILLALALPVILYAREAARRTACQSNLRQIGIAVLHYNELNGVLPLGRDATAAREHCWVTAVLPQLELAVLFQRYSYDHVWNDDSPGVENRAISETTLPLFLCPSTAHTFPGATDYGGNYGSSLSGLPRGFGIGYSWDSGALLALGAPSKGGVRAEAIPLSHVTDGLAQTFLVVEDAGRPADLGGLWANGLNCLGHEFPKINEHRQQGIFSDHPAGANVLMVDGSVRLLSAGADRYVLGACSTRSHGEVVDVDKWETVTQAPAPGN